jgi:hypothetical protein
MLTLCAGTTVALGQTNPPARTLPFTETFSSGVPSNFAGWNGLNGSSITTQAQAEASTPTGNASVISGVPGTTGGLYNTGSSIGVTYSTNATNGADQWAFAINTTSNTSISLDYDLTTTAGGVGRPAQMVAQYRVGITGGWTTLPSVAGNPFTSGATGNIQHVHMTLPPAAENQAMVQIRYANWRGGGSGSSDRYTIDNVAVSGAGVDPNAGACCLPDGSCVTNLTAACSSMSGTFQGMGSACVSVSCPQPPGSCCVTGTGCVLVSAPADCTAMSGSNFVINGTCSPGPCIPPTPVLVQLGDIAYANSNAAATNTLFQIRGVGSPSPTMAGSWEQFAFIEFARFDNTGGVYHNGQGNLLGLDFGAAAGGGPLYVYSTDGTNNALPILDTAGFNAIMADATNPRVSGLSVSPNNDRIAVIGYDVAKVAVMSYNAGGTPGTGSGASITGGAATSAIPYLISPKGSWGSAWLDNDTVLVCVRTGGQNVTLYTLPVTGIDVGTSFGTPVARVSVTDPGPDASPQIAMAYNPQLSNYIYILSSAFVSPTSTNTLYIVDPATWTIAKQVNLSTSLQTGRDLAIGNDHNLYLSGRTDTGRSQISKLVLDANSDGTISAAEIAAIADNSSTDFFTNALVGNAGFSGLDVAIVGNATPTGACCNATTGACSPIVTSTACTGQGGNYQGDNSACSPNPCPQPPPQGVCCDPSGSCSFVVQTACTTGTWTSGGTCTPNTCPQPPAGVCCRGATCNTSITQGACHGNTLAGAVFVTGAPNCNGAGISTTPCCYADYNKIGGVTVGDIFDFLNDWFAGSPFAVPGTDGTATTLAVQNIFDFLNNWFAGGC